jgi:hypothetical protein
MGQGNEQPSTGLMVLGASAMVLCCLVPLVLLSIGTAGLVALLTENAWWLGLGGVALIIGAVAARMSRMRRSRPGPERAAGDPVQHREERNRP